MASDNFPTGTAGLAPSVATPVVELSDGDELDLTIAPVTKEIAGDTVRMLAYNGSIPGPTLKVKQSSEIVVNARNEGDLEATVHWHGLRLDNRYDGTHETQAPMPVGRQLHVPHRVPRSRPLLVPPAHPRGLRPGDGPLRQHRRRARRRRTTGRPRTARSSSLSTTSSSRTGRSRAFSRSGAELRGHGPLRYHDARRRRNRSRLEAKRGEIVRFFLTNTANTRVFRVGFAGASMKLVGGDSGRVEREEFAEDVILAPSERVVVDVLFDTRREAALEHRTPEHDLPARLPSPSRRIEAESLGDFHALRENADLVAERERIAPYLEAEPDKTLSLVAEMDMGDSAEGATGVFACPMHADIVATWEGKCPKCGMKLLPAGADVAAPTDYACPMHPEITATWAGECPKCGMTLRADGRGDARGSRASPPRPRPRPRRRGRHRVGGRHGRGQPRDHSREHALARRRQGHRRPRATRSTGASASATR